MLCHFLLNLKMLLLVFQHVCDWHHNSCYKRSHYMLSKSDVCPFLYNCSMQFSGMLLVLISFRFKSLTYNSKFQLLKVFFPSLLTSRSINSIAYFDLKSIHFSPLPPPSSKLLLFCTWITAINSYLVYTSTLEPPQPRLHSAGNNYLKQSEPNHSVLKSKRLLNILISHLQVTGELTSQRCLPGPTF